VCSHPVTLACSRAHERNAGREERIRRHAGVGDRDGWRDPLPFVAAPAYAGRRDVEAI
jgi:hypothetical protein